MTYNHTDKDFRFNFEVVNDCAEPGMKIVEDFPEWSSIPIPFAFRWKPP
jgi:hypothetical protein